MLRPKRFLGNLLLSIAVTAIALLGTEFAWRQIFENGDVSREFNEKLRFVNPPNAEWVIRTKDYRTHIRTNSLGFRGPEMPAGQKGDELRVLFLGDSFVEAKQVKEEERFAERTGALLAEELGKSVMTRVLAMGGSNPALELLYYREIGREFDADIVVQVLFPENDLLPMEGPYTFRTESGDLVLEDIWVEPAPPCPWRCEMLKRSSILRAFYHSLRRKADRETMNPRQMLGDYYWYTSEGQDVLKRENRWDVLQALVGTLRWEVERDGGLFLTVLIPSGFEMQSAWQKEYLSESSLPRESWNISQLLSTAEDALHRESIPVLDLRDAFLGTVSDEDPLYYKSDPHLSLRGHEVAAQAIAEALLRLR
ncbi:hypothetical protein COU79_03320 [Candidatus Peregrinibacteria bacterium CG10_big_fil_rev_8_21_14_0_10_54_7]|nr:MAG: hypothetical protein COU79_03320 [Candidatus Peregrinibacteria bacterium CG10_big_fil_rev_8_21_14_0_10_54_7]